MALVSRPRPIASTIGLLFGGLWAVIAVSAAPPAWRAPLGVFAAGLTALLLVRLWRAGETAAGGDGRLFRANAYRIAVMAEVAAIYAASAILARIGWQSYFLQSVGIIVGLHFVGLWWASRSPRFLGIAGGMCLVSAAAIPFPAVAGLFHVRDFITGAGNAMILWIGAGGTVARRA